MYLLLLCYFFCPAMWVHGVCPIGMGYKYKGTRSCVSCNFAAESLYSSTSNFLFIYSYTKHQVGLPQALRQAKQFSQHSPSWEERWALRCYTTRYCEHADSHFCLVSLCMLGSSCKREKHHFQWPHLKLCASSMPGDAGASAPHNCAKGTTRARSF